MCRSIYSKEVVRLVRDLPELGLPAGAVGVVLSAWFYPTTAYEVEFSSPGPGGGTGNRLLLLEDEVAPVEGVPAPAAGLAFACVR